MLFTPALIFAPLIFLFAAMPDFNSRAEMFGIASEPEVMKLANKPNVIFLDVRSDDEIADAKLITSKTWVHSNVTPMAAPELESNPEAVVGDDKEVPIVIYCGSGKRANKALEVLKSQGYTNVVNAGGLGDVDYLKQ